MVAPRFPTKVIMVTKSLVRVGDNVFGVTDKPCMPPHAAIRRHGVPAAHHKIFSLFWGFWGLLWVTHQ